MKRVLVMGTFDLTHAGHFDLFRQAKALGDHLTVGVAHDKLNRVFKGEGHPIYPIAVRHLIIEDNKNVDAVEIYGANCPESASVEDVIACNRAEQIRLIEAVEPAIFAQGIDNAPPILDGYIEQKGIDRVYLHRLSSEISTSYYIEKIRGLPCESKSLI